MKYFLAPLALAFGLTMTAAHAGDLNLTCEMKRTKGEWVMPRFDLIEA